MDILKTIEELKKLQEGSISEVAEIIRLAKLDVKYLLIAVQNAVPGNEVSEYIETLIDAAIDISWEECNIGHWSNVSETPKAVYAYASFQKVILYLMIAACDENRSSKSLNEAIHAADLGLMLGKGFHRHLSRAATMITTLIGTTTETPVRSNLSSSSHSSRQTESDEDCATERLNWVPLDRLHCPSFEEFRVKHFNARFPVLLSGCMNHWPAMSRWNDLDYLVKVAGPRTVPIEIGSAYTQKDWGMELTSFKDFINKYIVEKPNKVGYLAQHQLFDQIPELRKDIIIPDYCCLTDTEDGDCDVNINAWFGPAGTLTPLHHDPKHNLLCQVVGAKRIILYSPQDSEFLYPHDESMLNNTAQVDPCFPDDERFPNFKKATAYLCKLNPGEMLYIPPKWWHHVLSVEMSFSVSFWWE